MPPEYATRQDVVEIRQDLRIHTQDDKDFQERMFTYLNRRFDKLDIMWDNMNLKKGAEQAAYKTEVENDKRFQFKGWVVNALIAIATAYGTIKAIK